MKKILFVVGTRPEIIKTASVIQELRRDRSFRVGVCLSGQHISMVTQMLEDFDIELDYDLKIMEKNQTLVTISKKLIPRLDEVYDDFRPDLVFVQGDTTTAFIASFVAFYKGIKVAHIEAGLRTFDKNFPFPEEVNRTLLTRIADWHFAPTRAAKKNLTDEGVKGGNIIVTGNTGIDSLKYIVQKDYDFVNKRLQKLPRGKKIILLTAHRRENFGKRMTSIFKAVKDITLKYKDVLVVYPVHPNPNVAGPAHQVLSGLGNVMLLPNLHYRDLVKLMAASYMILTDSGGIQEEAPSLGRPVLVLRDNTERPEAVKAGSAKVVGADRNIIRTQAEKLLKGGSAYKRMAVPRDIFGKGNAARRIVSDVKNWLGR
ncbi:MAG: UDP-N-acetylglucosamine 2-epimerase (non-hydrolyzing) [Candidatus Omnitrophota bacterium]